MDKITHKVRCEQWTNIIKECLTSGMSKTTWCREDGISDKSFFYWQRILREEAYLSTLENTLTPAVKENSVPTTTDFVEIKMTDHTSSSASPFKPDVVIRRGSVSIEISNKATEELLNKVGGASTCLMMLSDLKKFLLPQGYPHDIFILIFFMMH
jgi:hypothetical protein